MTFAPDFAFYRDDRELDASPADSFWDAMKAEAHATFTERQSAYPSMVAKGRMSRADADRELRVARAIAEDWGALPHSAGFPIASWAEIVHALRREITRRRKFYPERVAAKRMDPADAERRVMLLEIWHDLVWHSSHPDAVAARAAVPAPPLKRAA